VDVVFQTDQFGRVTCNLADAETNAVVTASDRPQALAGLASALDALLANGIGECFWHEAAGEYRWVFRRTGEKVRVAVMWSTGTVSGWEHVFWSECDLTAFARSVRVGLDAVLPSC
jgi:hypothetical protein